MPSASPVRVTVNVMVPALSSIDRLSPATAIAIEVAASLSTMVVVAAAVPIVGVTSVPGRVRQRHRDGLVELVELSSVRVSVMVWLVWPCAKVTVPPARLPPRSAPVTMPLSA